MPEPRPSRAKQLLTVLLASGLAAYGAISGAWAPLFAYLTVVSALVAIGAGHRGEARYGPPGPRHRNVRPGPPGGQGHAVGRHYRVFDGGIRGGGGSGALLLSP